MTSAFAGRVEFVVGVTGVTRLIDTGMLTTVVTSVDARPAAAIGVSDTTTVAVNVPFGRLVGSLATVSVTPSGGRMPVGGEGGWDYLRVDPDAHRIYISRGTHMMVVDGKLSKRNISSQSVQDFPVQVISTLV